MKERKEERDIKYNEKDRFTPIFNGEKNEVRYGGLTEGISGGLSYTFLNTGGLVKTGQTTGGLIAISP